MADNYRIIEVDSNFQPELSSAGSRLVVVDFFATWCGPCHRISPVYEQFAVKYPRAMFLKVDVDKCSETAVSNGVSAMPTFIFFRNRSKVDMLRGADAASLEEKIKKWYGSTEGSGEDDDNTIVKGHMDLSSLIDKNACECLNEAEGHTLNNALTTKEGHLESDCDEQLLVTIGFNQVVKLHSIRIHGPPDNGPKTVKLFINQPKSLDFDSAESMTAVQELELTPEEIQDGSVIPLRYVKFQNVSSVTVFVKDNQTGTEMTCVKYLGFIGTPGAATNMAEFKRIAGKKGESH